jgi:hypothetical protein
MAIEVTLGGGGDLFVGEDKRVVVEILDRAGDPVDLAGWTTALVLKARDADVGAVLSLAGTVTGTHNAVRATNTQRLTFTATDTQTATLAAKTYRYSVKRTDDGSETILAFGPCIVERATQT